MFTQLHNHSIYSLLDGAIKISDMAKTAKKMGMSAVALTDHGSMAGIVEFYNACRKEGIKPLLGCEVYTTPYGINLTEKSRYHHLILIAKSWDGYVNLCRIVSRGWTEGFYKKPRVDFETIEKWHKDIICLSACLSGEVPRLILDGREDRALEIAKKYKNLFGDDYYIEVQDHFLNEDPIVNRGLVKIAGEIGAKIVATNDCHYLKKEDAQAHDVMLCIQYQDKMSNPKRHRFGSDEFYFKSEEEMRRLFPQEYLDNTMEIADKCNAELWFGTNHLPDFGHPKEFKSDAEFFEHICYKGLYERYKNPPEEYKQRLAYEIGIIEQMNFVGYFLIVQDFINWAKNHNILVGPGRGCVTKDTLIITSQGYKKIQDIRPGERVLTHDGTFHTVVGYHKYPTEPNETLYRPRCYYGDNKSGAYTNNHLLYAIKASKETNKKGIIYKNIPNDLKPEWIRAENIQPGDLLAFPKLSVNEENCIIDFTEYANDKCVIGKDKITEFLSQNEKSDFSIHSLSKKTGLKRSTISNFANDRSRAKETTVKKIKDSLGNMKIEEWKKVLAESKQKNSNEFPREFAVNEDFSYFLGIMTGNGWISKENRLGITFHKDKICYETLEYLNKTFNLCLHKRKNNNIVTFEWSSPIMHSFFLDFWEGYNKTAQTKTFPDWMLRAPKTIRLAFLEGLWDTDGSHKEKSKYTTSSRSLFEKTRLLLNTLNIPNGATYRAAHASPGRKVENSAESWQITVPHRFNDIKRQFGDETDEYILKRVFRVDKETSDFVYDITVGGNHSYVTPSFIAHNSGAGSLACYCMRITEIDPMKHDLLFERFLNPERVSMPDIDVDFPDSARYQVIDYVKERYGYDHVTQIATFTEMKAKSAFKNTARVFGVDYDTSQKVSDLIPDGMTLEEAYEEMADLRKAVSSSILTKVYHIAEKLQGNLQSASKHAGGVLIADAPVTDYAPLMMAADKKTKEKFVVVQYQKQDLEPMGLIKNDFLGLKTLTVIGDTVAAVKKNYGVDIDINHLDPGKYPEVCAMLVRENTIGVFQFESNGMIETLNGMFYDIDRLDRAKTDEERYALGSEFFERLVAGISLYRPGPMQYIPDYIQGVKDPSTVRYDVPELKPILGTTYGVIVYQGATRSSLK